MALLGVSGYEFAVERGFKPAIEDTLDQRVLLPVWASLCCEPGTEVFDSERFWDETTVTCPTDVCYMTGTGIDTGGKIAIKEAWIQMYDPATEQWLNIFQHWFWAGNNYESWSRKFTGSVKVRAQGLDFLFFTTSVGGYVRITYAQPQLELTVTGATISVDQSEGACTATGVQSMIYNYLDEDQFVSEADVFAGTNPQDVTKIDTKSFSPYMSSVPLYSCKGFVERWQDYPWTYNGYELEDGRKAICDTVHNELIEVESYETSSGTTYLIPSNVIEIVECCAWDDCVGSPNGPWCNEEFKCTDGISTIPCNNDMECEVQGTKAGISADCVVKPNGQAVLTHIGCDGPALSYSNKAGSCRLAEETVECCQSQCGSGLVCDYERGCIQPIQLKDCPEGSCCRSGIVVDGIAYKQTQDCPLGLECCPQSANYGVCEEDCEAAPPSGEGDEEEEEGYGFGLLLIIILMVVVMVVMIFLGSRKKSVYGSQALRRRRL